MPDVRSHRCQANITAGLPHAAAPHSLCKPAPDQTQYRRFRRTPSSGLFASNCRADSGETRPDDQGSGRCTHPYGTRVFAPRAAQEFALKPAKCQAARLRSQKSPRTRGSFLPVASRNLLRIARLLTQRLLAWGEFQSSVSLPGTAEPLRSVSFPLNPDSQSEQPDVGSAFQSCSGP